MAGRDDQEYLFCECCLKKPHLTKTSYVCLTFNRLLIYFCEIPSQAIDVISVCHLPPSRDPSNHFILWSCQVGSYMSHHQNSTVSRVETFLINKPSSYLSNQSHLQTFLCHHWLSPGDWNCCNVTTSLNPVTCCITFFPRLSSRMVFKYLTVVPGAWLGNLQVTNYWVGRPLCRWKIEPLCLGRL